MTPSPSDTAAPLEAAPFAHDIADAWPEASAWWCSTSDGVRIRVARLGSGVKGTVLMFTGRTEYVEKYGRAGRALAERGYSTLAVDWRGQGLADRLLADSGKGHVLAFGDYQNDVAAMVAAAAALDLPRPYHLVGHSMGGAIGLRALHEGLDVASAVFSAPMWGIHFGPVLRPIADALAAALHGIGLGDWYAPGTSAKSYTTTAPFSGNVLTHDPEVFTWMKAQLASEPDLSLGGPTVRWLHLALRECADLLKTPAPNVPCLTSLGSDETVVSPDSIRKIMAGWPKGELLEVQGARHEVMMETVELRTLFYDKACALFDAHSEDQTASQGI